MKFNIVLSTVIVVCGLFVSKAHGTLIGETISTDFALSSTSSATISPTVEFSLTDGFEYYIDVDFDEDSVTFRNIYSTSISLYSFGMFNITGFDAQISGLSIFTNDSVSGSLIENFSFTSNSLSFDFSGSKFLLGGDVKFSIETIENVIDRPIPEPASLALTVVGLFFLRRKFSD